MAQPRARCAFISLLVLVGLAVAAAPALAQPRLSLRLPTSADANTAIGATYSAVGIPRGVRLVLQRQQGLKRVWKTIPGVRVSRGVASVTLPGLSLGLYRFRLAALRSRAIIAQQQRTIRIYGSVPLDALFGGRAGVYTTSAGTFAYVFDVYDTDATAFTATHNRCRAVHVRFVPGDDDGPRSDTGTLSVVQESRDPIGATTAVDAPASVDAALTPGQSWSVNVAEPSSNYRVFDWYINGTADCFSAAPAN